MPALGIGKPAWQASQGTGQYRWAPAQGGGSRVMNARQARAIPNAAGGLPAGLRCKRATTGTYIDQSGVMQVAPPNTPRVDWGTGTPRLLVEQEATNLLPNGSFLGGTVGVIGSGGVYPPDFGPFSLNGLSAEIVAQGTINGFPYFDFRLYGTATNNYQVFAVNTGATASVANENYCASFYTAIMAGSLSGTNGLQFQMEADISIGNIFVTNSTLTRYVIAGQPAQTTGRQMWITFNLQTISGDACDVTIRLAAFQIETGLTPSSYIPTVSAPATRAADAIYGV